MPRSTRSKVRAKITKYWPDVDPQEVLNILDEYGVESYETGQPRVHLAILKLCEGQREKLPKLVEMAKRDYRDVLAFAEYPEQMKKGFIEMDELSEEEAQAVRKRDTEQYLKWLED